MKIWITLFCFLCTGTMLFSQTCLENKTDFYVNEASLEAALLKLSDENKIGIAFGTDILPKGQRVSIEKKNISIGHVLQAILHKTNIEFKLVGSQVVLFVPEYTISGFIEDGKTGERLIAANIFTSDFKALTSSNNYGFYSITLEKGTVELIFSYLGYKRVTKQLYLDKDIELDVALEEPNLVLDEIVVLPDNIDSIPSITSLNKSLVDKMPAIGGERDMIRATHFLPGVQTGADGIGGIYVRGGNTDQNLILLDGVPVYNPYHLLGLISVFNNNVISHTNLIKGNFPARYGGRLSSVLDIRTREGNSKNFNLETGINLFDANVVFEGPIVKDKASFMITARQSILNAYIIPFTRKYRERQNQHGGSAYNFYDINAKFNFSVSEKDKVYVSLYNGQDRFNDEVKLTYADSSIDISKFQLQDLNWGNSIGSIRWNHVYNNKLFSNTNITYSSYNFRSRESVELVETRFPSDPSPPTTSEQRFFSRYSSYIQDYAAYTNFDYVPSQQHYLKFGAGFIRHDFQPGVFVREIETQDAAFVGDLDILDTPSDTLIEKSKNWNNEFFVYLEDEWKPIPQLEFNLGLRTSGFHVQGHTYQNLEPRLSGKFHATKNLNFFAAWSNMTQYLHFLSRSSFVFPTDLWVPSTRTIAPQKAWQVSGGLELKPAKNWFFSGEVYYKEMNNLIEFQEASSILRINAENWEENVTVGRGWAYGSEFMLEQKSSIFSSWIAYTLSWTKRHFEGLNQGNVFPFRYDRRHNLKASFLYNLSRKQPKKVQLSANWAFGSGTAYTLPVSEFEAAVDTLTFLEPRNSRRLRHYHRLDFSVNINIYKKWGKQMLKFGVYNIYNRRNPLYRRLGRNPNDPSQRTLLEANIFPIFPFFSYNVKI